MVSPNVQQFLFSVQIITDTHPKLGEVKEAKTSVISGVG